MCKGAVKYIVGGSMVVAGIVLMILGALLGGGTVFNAFHDGIYFNSYGIHFSGDTDYQDLESKIPMDEVKNLYVDFDWGEMTIRSDKTDNVLINAENIDTRHYSCEVQENDGTLKITYKRGFAFFSFSSDAKIEIVVPESLSFDRADISKGAGKMNISGISVNDLIIENGAGDTTVERITAQNIKISKGAGNIDFSNTSADTLSLENGAGETTLTGVDLKGKFTLDGGAGAVKAADVTCGGMDIDLGVGEFTFTGTLNGSADVDCGVGEVKMTLYGDEKDYDFQVDGGVGKITTPGRHQDAEYVFKIDAGVGAVDVTVIEKTD